MTIPYLKRKAKEFENELREKENSKSYQSVVNLEMLAINLFIQYLEESK